jgi:hypothetical protein
MRFCAKPNQTFANCAFATAFLLLSPWPTLARGDSSSNRDAHPFFVSAMPLGFIPRGAAGIALGVHIGPRSALELFGETGKSLQMTEFDESIRTRAGIRFLGFPTDSLFIGFGLAYDEYVNRKSDRLALPADSTSQARIR